jgi:hypothetical protein
MQFQSFEDNEGSIFAGKVSANAVSLSYRRAMRALFFFTLKTHKKRSPQALKIQYLRTFCTITNDTVLRIIGNGAGKGNEVCPHCPAKNTPSPHYFRKSVCLLLFTQHALDRTGGILSK